MFSFGRINILRTFNTLNRKVKVDNAKSKYLYENNAPEKNISESFQIVVISIRIYF